MALDEWDLELAKNIPNNTPAERSIRILNAKIDSLKKEIEEAEFIRDTLEYMQNK